jgi:hypothetical protein
MKAPNILILSFFILIFLGCRPEAIKIGEKTLTESKNELTEIKIPENVDEDFKDFLNYFSKDSIFQVSRVIFPLRVLEVDENNMIDSIEKSISKKEYTKLDFTYPKDALTREFDKYTQKIKTTENKTVVEIRGFDNGICTDFVFEKLNGKWFLKSWNDTSN